MYQLALVAVVAIVLLVALAFRRKPPPPSSIEPWVIEEFRKKYRQQILMAVPTAVFLVWVLKYPSSGGALHGLLWLLAFVVVVGVCVFTYRNWRCPKCGAYLGRNPMYDWRCPNCGTALREP